MQGIVLWCNGSTTDSGPVCLGSNPSRTTTLKTYNDDDFTLFYGVMVAQQILVLFVLVRIRVEQLILVFSQERARIFFMPAWLVAAG